MGVSSIATSTAEPFLVIVFDSSQLLCSMAWPSCHEYVAANCESYLASHDERAESLCSVTAYDHTLARQHKHTSAARSSFTLLQGGKHLQIGDLSYLLTRMGSRKPDVKGLFVVVGISDNTVHIRITGVVEGQGVKHSQFTLIVYVGNSCHRCA